MSRTPITWFEIASDRPDEAQRFYADLFGWTFEEQGEPGASYRQTEAGGEQGIHGAIRATNGEHPNYAIFYAEVTDVAETCRRAEAAGGKILVPLHTAASGLTFAHLMDPSGNHLGVFAPPAAA
ncbi:VOC family protein [Micromonospora mangrovi]|uniref:VOC family protein n=2 Tax=Micromonospora TaxID=1873 RepID=A0AAU7M9L7_9ACTN